MMPLLCHNGGVAADFNIALLRRRVTEIMAARGMKPTSVSLALGKSPTLIRDLMEKSSDVKLSTLTRLANHLDVDISDLLNDNDISPASVGPTLYVKGEVAAGVWRDAEEFPQSEWQSFSGRPDVNAAPEHRFGLIVRGDSMDEIYPPGTIIECVSVFGHAEIKPGKRVVVVRYNKLGQCEATVKELVERDGEFWAVPRSTNPTHIAFRLDQDDGEAMQTRISAIVVASVRPE